MSIKAKSRNSPATDESVDDELIDTLIAVSVVAKRLAMKMISKKGGQYDEQNK